MSSAIAPGARGHQGEVVEDAERFERSATFRWLVRAGFLARALTYAVVGALAVALGLGAGTDGVPPDQQGALALIAQNWLGDAALAVVAVGLLAYAMWKLGQGAFGRGPEGGGSPKAWDRLSNIAGGIGYLVFFTVAVRTLAGSAGNSSGGPKHAAAGVLGLPAGPLLVAIGGMVLVAISAYQIYEAVTASFAEEVKTERMRPAERRSFTILGRVGISARAVAFALVGYFVVATAITYDPQDAVGLDGALARLHHQAYGPELVGLVGAGFIVFAAYSILEGWYRRL